jgi:hypothetical protein
MTAPGQYASVRYLVGDVAGGLDAEITRLSDAGLAYRGGLVAGPGGRQILPADPAGNLIELSQPAHRPANPAEAS